jgi:hypothetical protein
MGGQCLKGQSNSDQELLNEKRKREYYLNLQTTNSNSNNEIGAENYDIREQKKVGYGHI